MRLNPLMGAVLVLVTLTGCAPEEPLPVETPASEQTPAPEQSAPTGEELGTVKQEVGEIDLLPYFCPACVSQGTGRANKVGDECFYTFGARVKGKSGFYINKSCNNADGYEEFTYDNTWIYHLADTTWASKIDGVWQNAKCYDGRPAYSTYLNANVGAQNGDCSGFVPSMGSEGGRWALRWMAPGQSTTNTVTIVAFAEGDCGCCKAQYTGPSGRTIKLVSKETLDLGNGLGVREVVRLAIMSGPGGGENFWYAKNYGWIGFQHVSPPDAPFSYYNVGNRISGVVTPPYTQKTATCGVEKKMAFKTVRTSNWVVAEGGGGRELRADRTGVGPWETFILRDKNGGDLWHGDEVNIIVDNGAYLVAENGGGSNMNANRWNPGPWETFRIYRHGGGRIDGAGEAVYLRAYDPVTPWYWSATNGGGTGSILYANRNSAAEWETFYIYRQ